MRRLKIIICGTRFGQFYLEALLKRDDLFEVIGILGKGGESSAKCAEKYGISVYTSTEDLPDKIDLACVILKAGVMGGDGIKIAQKLLRRGINVLHEQPVHYKELVETYKVAKEMKCFFGVSNFYKYIDATQNYIGMVREIQKKEEIQYINIECAHQILYSVLGVLFDMSDRVRPFEMGQIISGNGSFDILQCYLHGIPCTIKIHNEVNPDDPDNFFYLFYRFQIGFEGGDIILEDPSGPVLWHSRVFIPHEFEYGKNSYEGLENKNLEVIQDGNKYNDILWREWILAIERQLAVVKPNINHTISANAIMQTELYQAKQWHLLMKTVGYPRAKTFCNSSNNTAGMLREYLFKKRLFDGELSLILSNLKEHDLLERKKILDDTCLKSMLYTIQKKEGCNCIALDRIYSLGKEDNSNDYIIDRWLKALVENRMITVENGHVFFEVIVTNEKFEQAWERAKQAWISVLSDKSVIDYYYENAKHLPELLKGTLNASYLLFPEGKMELAMSFYTNTLIGRYLNIAMSEAVRKRVHDGMTLLELGAGTGSSTNLILDKIEGLVNYIFTDLSRFFLNSAQKRFALYPGMKYQILDIDRNFEEQGIREGTADMVIAAGMLNNASDTAYTLKNIHRALKPGGSVFIAEPVGDLLELQISQIFMMTQPIDIRSKYNETFMTEEQWLEVLDNSGFEITECIPPKGNPLTILKQKLFIGRKREKC